MRKMGKKGQGAMEYLMTYGWAIMVVMIVGVVLWQMGIFKIGSGGKGQTGFSQVKVLDHTATGVGANTPFLVVFMNVAGVPINGTAQIITSTNGSTIASLGDGLDITAGGDRSARVATGDKTDVNLVSDANECPAADDSYDVRIQVVWTNTITDIVNDEDGRIWGPC